MFRSICCIFVLAMLTCSAVAQDLKTTVGDNKELDSLRKREQNHKDSIVFTSKYIRYTTLRLSRDSLQTFPLDTTLRDFQNYSVLNQPRRPTYGLGNLGLAAMPLLFEPRRNIGFDPGFHSLDLYYLNHEDILFYRARTPFSSLYYVNGGETEQVFRAIYSQNIKKNWNAGFNFNRNGANGFYTNQRGDDLGAAIFTWYQSPNNRYNLFATAVFNTLKAEENGSILNDTIFNGNSVDIDRMAEGVRLNTARQLWRRTSVSMRSTYFLGRIDSVGIEGGGNKLLPTNKIAYNLTYTRQSFAFFKDEIDDNSALPVGYADNIYFTGSSRGYTADSTSVKHLSNEFVYSFFLRPKSGSFFKNELKIDAGIRHDFYQYEQQSRFKDKTSIYDYTAGFQNITITGNAGYRFSSRLDLNVSLEQVVQGRNFGDFLYEAKGNVLLGNRIGRIAFGAWIQNKSPEQIYERYFSNHYQWDLSFDNSKTINASFGYINEKLGLDARAEYFLLTDHLYFTKNGPAGIIPVQETGSISLLRLALGKNFVFGKFNLDLFAVYQQTSNTNILRTPDFYTFNRLYFNQTFFKVLKTQVGADVRYNSAYQLYSYSAAASQFYTGDPVKPATSPVASVWVKAALRRANLFVKYDYANQGLFDRGYYTTNLYPMGDRLFKFGVQWNFYD